MKILALNLMACKGMPTGQIWLNPLLIKRTPEIDYLGNGQWRIIAYAPHIVLEGLIKGIKVDG